MNQVRQLIIFFLEVNHAFELLTGLKADDILGKKVTESNTRY